MKSDQSAQELPGEMKQVKSPPRSPENAPKCSTQRGKSLPKSESPCSHTSSSLNHSRQSDLSISEILLDSSYAPVYKGRKIRQKVEAAIGSMEAACLEKGNLLGDQLACSCLFKHKINIGEKEIISYAFSEVATERGAQKAFDELYPVHPRPGFPIPEPHKLLLPLPIAIKSSAGG